MTQAAAAGVDVRMELVGERRALPAPIDAAAFRIVQEALTNVVRHARATTAVVRIGYGAHDLTVQVDDDGDGAGQKTRLGAGGTGIRGMRERVRALGGEFEAGRRAERGFRVRARLPEDDVR